MATPMAATPPPKGPRSRHQHSRSAHNATVNQQTGQSARQTHHRNKDHNRNNYNANNQVNYAATQSDAQVDASDDQTAMTNGFASDTPRRQRPQKTARTTSGPTAAAGAMSPRDQRRGGHAQSHQPAPATTPAKNAAYAGPTFHASPAPSALPVPKFFSKSVPAATSESGMQARLDKESDSSPSASPPEVPPLPEAVPVHQSPLDIFFKAQREEIARTNSGKLSPPGAANGVVSPRGSGIDARHHNRQPSNGSQGVFMMELDGTGINPSQTDGPAAYRASRQGMPQPVVTPGKKDLNQSLKDMLISLPQPPNTVPHNLYGNQDRQTSEPGSRQSRSPFQRANSAPRASSGGAIGPSFPSDSAANQPLHYGNRNLSTLFKAAQSNDASKRASNLRQEVTADSPVAQQGQFGPVFPPPGPAMPGRQRDTSTFTRDFLNSQIAHGNASMPQLPLTKQEFSNGRPAPGSNPGFEMGRPGYHAPYQLHAGVSSTPALVNGSTHSPVSSPPSYAGPNGSQHDTDIQTMESNLRRLLKLDAIS